MITLRLLGLMLLAGALAFTTGCRTTCDGRTESEICQVHNVMMETKDLDNTAPPPPQPPPDYLYASHYLFPHSYPYVLPDKCKSVLVYICSDCVRAEQQWRAQHYMMPIPGH